jgi:hypothetical protein
LSLNVESNKFFLALSSWVSFANGGVVVVATCYWASKLGNLLKLNSHIVTRYKALSATAIVAMTMTRMFRWMWHQGQYVGSLFHSKKISCQSAFLAHLLWNIMIMIFF